MSKTMTVVMLAGGALLFFIILILVINSFSGPTQAPRLENSQEAIDETGNVLIDEAQFQGVGNNSYSSRETGFGGDRDLVDEEGSISAGDSDYGQLPPGELRDNYIVPQDDSDNNGFIDFQKESFGF
jgi:hypothetical protein